MILDLFMIYYFKRTSNLTTRKEERKNEASKLLLCIVGNYFLDRKPLLTL